MTDQAPTKSGRGCLFYGSLTGIICLVAILIAGLLGLHQLKRMLNEYTDTQPAPLPAVQVPPAQMEEVRLRVESFRDAVQAARPASPLSLTSDEINALIAVDPNFQDLRGKLHVAIEGNLLKGQISAPLSEIGLPRFRGRYLNGTGTFSLSFQNGILDVRAEQLVVKGKPLPLTYLDAIRKQNLAAKLNDNPRAAAVLNHLEAVRVEDGKLLLIPKLDR
jgi:hypothetical protein